MKLKQMIILGCAFAAAIAMAFIGRSFFSQDETIVAEEIAPAEIAEPVFSVLVAAADIPAGSSLGAARLAWEERPQDIVGDSFIVREREPKALEEYSSAIARSDFLTGDPIRARRVVRSDSGYLSIILPAGKRAIAVRIEAETSAGGFILPNDRVDVIMSYRTESDIWLTETVLESIRVLAIDNLVGEKDGEKNLLGETATLEVSAEQAEILATAKAVSDNRLTLALRALADSNPDAPQAPSRFLQGENPQTPPDIDIVRYGVSKNVIFKN